MDNFKFKTEETTDENILSDIAKQEVDNKSIPLCFNFTTGEEAIQLESVKKENVEERAKGTFETIFLPVAYEGVEVETTFFNFDKYKTRRGLPVEKTGINQSIVPNSFPHLDSNNTDNFRHIQDYYSCAPIIPNEQSCNINTHQESSIFYQNKNMFTENLNTGQYSCTANKVVQIDQNPKKQAHPTNSNSQRGCDKTSIGPATVRPNKFTNKDEDASEKYKCPLCNKRPRVFSTLVAVNNHLKFEHISVFQINGNKLRDDILQPKTDVDKLNSI